MSLKVPSETLTPIYQDLMALDIWVYKFQLHMAYPQAWHFISDFVGERNNIHAPATALPTFISFT